MQISGGYIKTETAVKYLEEKRPGITKVILEQFNTKYGKNYTNISEIDKSSLDGTLSEVTLMSFANLNNEQLVGLFLNKNLEITKNDALNVIKRRNACLSGWLMHLAQHENAIKSRPHDYIKYLGLFSTLFNNYDSELDRISADNKDNYREFVNGIAGGIKINMGLINILLCTWGEIKECAANTTSSETHFDDKLDLVAKYIDRNNIPAEYAHRALRIKTLNDIIKLNDFNAAYAKGDFDVAINNESGRQYLIANADSINKQLSDRVYSVYKWKAVIEKKPAYKDAVKMFDDILAKLKEINKLGPEPRFFKLCDLLVNNLYDIRTALNSNLKGNLRVEYFDFNYDEPPSSNIFSKIKRAFFGSAETSWLFILILLVVITVLVLMLKPEICECWFKIISPIVQVR
jgi:hypothetical protein